MMDVVALGELLIDFTMQGADAQIRFEEIELSLIDEARRYFQRAGA